MSTLQPLSSTSPAATSQPVVAAQTLPPQEMASANKTANTFKLYQRPHTPAEAAALANRASAFDSDVSTDDSDSDNTPESPELRKSDLASRQLKEVEKDLTAIRLHAPK